MRSEKEIKKAIESCEFWARYYSSLGDDIGVVLAVTLKGAYEWVLGKRPDKVLRGMDKFLKSLL